MSIVLMFDDVIPREKILSDARSFLDQCNWELEIGESVWVRIPRNTELRVRTRAFIEADAPDIFLDDHFEAVVILGCEEEQEHWWAKYGLLKLYYDHNGQFASEDRYPAPAG